MKEESIEDLIESVRDFLWQIKVEIVNLRRERDEAVKKLSQVAVDKQVRRY
jgi:ribosome recycling factor